MYRRFSVFIAAVVVALAFSSTAHAELRQGTATDAVGDNAAGSTWDLERVTASYDQGGAWSVTMRFASPLTAGESPSAFVSVNNNSNADAPCSGNSSAFASLLGSVASDGSLVFFSTNASGSGSYEGSRRYSADMRELTFSKSDARLKDFDYRCVTVELRRNGAVVDRLDPPLYFSGFEPDRDGDKVPDARDKCPDQGAPGTADGCTPAPAPAPVTAAPVRPTPPPVVAPAKSPHTTAATRAASTCNRPALKGKTLVAAKKILRKAGCKLGKVSKPKKVRKGARLVVTRQSGVDPVKLTLGVKKAKRA